VDFGEGLALKPSSSGWAYGTLILMDIIMPVMNGYDAIDWIRQMPLRQQTPIIAITAKAMQEDRTEILEAGATEYLSKPVNMEQLLALMKIIM
jgi:two-component system chemotaxis sensor kinase CheA